MVVRVVKVRRRDRQSWLQRAYVPMILRSLRVTARHFAGNLRARLSGTGGAGAATVGYPEQPPILPPAFRGTPRLVALEDGRPRCVACGLCEFACPTKCIEIVPGERDDAGIDRYPERFDLDLSRCMFCGLCEEACPEEAIVMSAEIATASEDVAALRLCKQDLLVPAAQVQERLDFLRRDYERPPLADAMDPADLTDSTNPIERADDEGGA